MKTAQEIFDQVVEHSRRQNEQAKQPVKGCLYRAGDLKCFVGCLIPDFLYDPDIECCYIDAEDACTTGGNDDGDPVKLHEILTQSGIDVDEHKKLLSELQTLHDLYQPSSWEDQLCLVARRHNLDFFPDTNAH